MATNPAKYDKDGKRIEWLYDAKTDECYEDPCFLTTACVDHAGLADDCFELSALRSFRDGRLAHMAGGAEDIARYYRNAPEIVARIMKSENASRELSRLYVRYILPSALAASFGFDRIARRIYTAMMRDLGERNGVTLT